ncbi:TPA: hypothetical protein ACF311_004612 [Vibrio parahaemolyticus]|uniref:DUF4760 domain-containing protein n=1 Tax=Vibrio harveyi group TaxID=717610 RepID=UPI0006C2F90F|nr:hypothetical protein [Vibrio parahaemolyticus]EGR1589650.1 hypothetical protein [Vibrio parahaemolyticus]EHR1202268.1 hypothetical protein [Vibrio parahaemolyticus]EHR5855631.1 hypothetical protein [Vibrio parahaemolyticus]KOY36143.1 hypothetical protein ACX10_17900 [Vibrio parahaemolyticus]MCX8860055.1 hypothetical protein [Vibrio parahaemolyticus]
MEGLLLFFKSESSWFWQMCQFFVIAFTLIVISMQLRTQRKANMLKALHKWDEKWHSKLMIRCRNQIGTAYLANNSELTEEVAHVANFFEDLGVHVQDGVIGKRAVWEFYSHPICLYWQLMKQTVENRRAEDRDETIIKNFEWLFNEMNKISKKNGAPCQSLSIQELNKHADRESNLKFLE